jgi:hypothetical protein
MTAPLTLRMTPAGHLLAEATAEAPQMDAAVAEKLALQLHFLAFIMGLGGADLMPLSPI